MPPKITQSKPPRQSKATNKSRNVLERIAPIGFDKDDGIKALLYGKSGTGKTTTWATFPDPILAVICSGGSKPGELRSIDTPENRERITKVVLEASSEIKELVDYADDSDIKTVVLDHASGLQDLVLKEILGIDEVPAQKSWGLATQQQYGQCTLQCKELLRCLLGLDCNVVIIAQERNFNEESQSDLILPTVGAGLTPSLTGWLNTAVDYICQTYIRQKEEIKKTKIAGNVVETVEKLRAVEYCLRTAPDPVFTTKFRLPKGANLPECIVDPSYDKIMRLIRGQTKSTTK